MEKNLLTIVVEYEGDEPPVTGFTKPVEGCKVIALSMGDSITRATETEDEQIAAIENLGEAVIGEVCETFGFQSERFDGDDAYEECVMKAVREMAGACRKHGIVFDNESAEYVARV